MKISQETLTLLENFSHINQGIKIVPRSSLQVTSKDNTIHAVATIKDIFPRDFCIFDLHMLINNISFHGKDPDFEFLDNELIIRGNNSFTIHRYAPDKVIHFRSPNYIVKLPPIVSQHKWPQETLNLPFVDYNKLLQSNDDYGYDVIICANGSKTIALFFNPAYNLKYYFTNYAVVNG